MQYTPPARPDAAGTPGQAASRHTQPTRRGIAALLCSTLPATLAAAPMDGLSAGQAVTPGAKGIAMGCCQLETLDDAELGRWLDDMRDIGTTWLRFDVMWSVVQGGGRTDWDWSRYDRIIAACVQRGIRPLLLLDTTPGWARPAGTTDWHPPTQPADFGAFAGAVALRYGPQGMHHYEIWNEPNLPGFWTSGPDARQYGALLASAHASLKSADPQAFLVSAGLSPASTGGGSISPVDFLAALYAAGVGSCFDAVGHHPYSWPAMPIEIKDWSAWSQMDSTPRSLRRVMRANGDATKPIWMTEFGAPTRGPAGSEALSEDRHAELISQAYAIAALRPWSGPLFLYAYRDHGTDLNDRENFFGLLRADGSRKPSYAAFARIPPQPGPAAAPRP